MKQVLGPGRLDALWLVVVGALLVACVSGSGGPTHTVTGRAIAGPTCPVETDPPQPGCEPRPVDGAVLVIVDEGGVEQARATTAPDGTFSFEVPSGSYTLIPQGVEGLMGTPAPIDFEAVGNLTLPDLVYDTGIR